MEHGGRDLRDFDALRRDLAETYALGQAAMETVARLADEHAEREERRGRLEAAALERRAAAKARDGATRCRANAERLR